MWTSRQRIEEHDRIRVTDGLINDNRQNGGASNVFLYTERFHQRLGSIVDREEEFFLEAENIDINVHKVPWLFWSGRTPPALRFSLAF
jgi:hypothetical protein